MSFPTATALAQPKIGNREQLIAALHSAAIVEHMLTCEYLYSGFSMRRKLSDFPPEVGDEQRRQTLEISRMWLAQVYLIARQEMEHLGIVMNLLAAVGADPYFERPTFPQPAQLVSAPFCLQGFGLESVRRFICYERPAFLTPGFCQPDCDPCAGDPAGLTPHPALNPDGYGTIQELYDQIGAAFQTLPTAELFQGNTDRQFQPQFGYAINLATITNRSEANLAIQQILEEGEGIGANPMSSDAHYQKFIAILAALEATTARDPQFAPAMPVVNNPTTCPHPQGNPTSPITDPAARLTMEFFNECYSTMLVMLITVFRTYSTGGVPEPPRQVALFYATFFPLMTMALRPLGEIIVHLPAGPEFPGLNAGPSFEINEPITLEPTREWYVTRLERLIEQARALIDIVPVPYRSRVNYIRENLTSTRIHLSGLW